MRVNLALIIVIFILQACSSSNNHTSFPNTEKSRIASFILVKTIPVQIITKDFALGSSLQKFITDTLKSIGYKFITEDERAIIQKRFYSDLFGSKDAEAAKKVRDKEQGDKEYYIREMERAAPLDQWISLFPGDSSGNQIGVLRVNYPAMKKTRKWLVPYEDSELVTTIAARIVDSLTARQSQ